MTTWRRSTMALLVLLGFTGLSQPAQAAPGTHHTVPIAVARTLPLGTEVTIDGTATTPSGAFESSFFDKGFALQDRTAGIYVSTATDPHITVRTQVRVTGTLRDSFGLLILVPDDPSTIRVHGKGPKTHPTLRRTGTVNEQSEGLLVRVVARITQPPEQDPPFGVKFQVDDGTGPLTIFINTQTGIDPSPLTTGQTVTITGFSSQFDTHYEIDPRFPADIAVLP